MYIKHCKFLIEPAVESKDNKKGTKTNSKVVHMEREKERDPDPEVRKRWTKEEKKLVMRCFYQNDPTRGVY